MTASMIRKSKMLAGMAVGGLVLPLCGLIGAPIGPMVLWASSGAIAGFVVVPMQIFRPHTPLEHRVWWAMCLVLSVVGSLVGAVIGAIGKAPPGWTWVMAATTGVLLGFAATEVWLTRHTHQWSWKEMTWVNRSQKQIVGPP